MKKLTKDQIKQKAEHVTALSDAHAELATARQKLVDSISTLHADVEAAESAYNSALEDAREFVQGIADDASNAFNDKSETFRCGEAGQTIADWINEWENLDVDDAGIPKPEVEELPEDASEILDALSNEAS
jgi:division protein CdvB (Snf7/Vps24/ESCRT-III family)